jgi:hypothetical protein
MFCDLCQLTYAEAGPSCPDLFCSCRYCLSAAAAAAYLKLLVSARSESEGFKSERDELAEVVLEMQEEIEALKAEREQSRT